MEEGGRNGKRGGAYDRELHLVACSPDPNRARIESQLGDLLPTLHFAKVVSSVRPEVG